MAGSSVRLVLMAALLIAGYGASHAATQVRFVMGTLYEVTVFTPDESAADRAIQAAFAEIERVDRVMSNYREDSALSRINREAVRGPTEIGSELLSIINKSLHYSRLSDGAFDITVGPLMRAWGFFKSEGRLPDERELAQALSSVGYSKIALDTEKHSIRFTSQGVEIDLGAIAKGYAVDRAITVLKNNGITAAVVNAGGNLYVTGDVPDDYALAGVQHPREDDVLAIIRLRDNAVSTSGDYEKFFTVGNRRYSHIMDPRTGMPVDKTISAIVVARTATEADALSTAVYVLGPKEGVRLVERLDGVECMLVFDSGEGLLMTVESSGWKNLTERNRDD